MEWSDTVVAAIVALVSSLVLTGKWIEALEKRLAESQGVDREFLLKAFFGKDMNKYNGQFVVRFGGIWSVIGITMGLLILEAYHTYVLGKQYLVSIIFAVVTLLLFGGFIGFVDDVMGWKIGIRPRYRIISTLLIAIPLSVVKAGQSTIQLPIIGKLNLGIWYSLLVVPIGVMGASNAFNMLAGFNGLEAGMASIILSFYALYAYHLGRLVSVKISIIALAGVLGFLYWNRYPARTFPGNAFTYAIGALLAAIVIIGNYEKYGAALFTLYFAELILMIRGLMNGVYKETFGVPNPDGSLEQRYDKIYSVAHFAIYVLKKIRGRATERGVVALILIMQFVIGVVVTLLMW